MFFQRPPLLFKSINGYDYYLSTVDNRLLYLHPVLSDIYKFYIKSKGNFENLKAIHTSVNNKQQYSIKEIEYYFKKFSFLLEKKYLNPGTGININILKKSDIINANSNIKHIVFEVTEACNFNCKYCIYGDLYEPIQSKEKKNLNVEIAKKILNYIFTTVLTSLPESFYISFYGGEPLLGFKFIKQVVLYVKKQWPDIKFNFAMTTNASLLYKHIDFLVEHDFKITISIDGNNHHNSYRTFKNGNQTFDVVYNNIIALKDKYPKFYKKNIDINSVITNRSNHKEVYQFIKKNLEKEPIIAHSLNPNGIKKNKIKEFQKINNAPKKMDSDVLTNFKTHIMGYDDLLASKKKNKKRFFLNHPNSTCLPFNVKLFVSAEGFLRPCEKVQDNFLGKFSREIIKIDVESILEKYKNLQKNANTVCSKCYNLNCTVCLACVKYDDKKFNCLEFKNKDTVIIEISSYESEYYDKYHNQFRKPSDKIFYFYIEPYVHIELRKKKILLHNTLNNSFLTSECIDVINLFKAMIDKKSFRIIVFDYENKNIINFLDLIRDKFMGDYLHLLNKDSFPIIYDEKPVFLDLLKDTDVEGQSMYSLLKEITIVLNNNDTTNENINKIFFQDDVVFNTQSKLNLKALQYVISYFKQSNINIVNIIGTNVLFFEHLPFLINALSKILAIKIFYAKYDDFLNFKNKKILNLFNSLKDYMFFRIVIRSQASIKEVYEVKKIIESYNFEFEFIFIVENENDIKTFEYYSSKFSSINFLIHPYFNNRNIDFFKNNFFITTENDIFEESNFTHKNILVNNIINKEYFGKLIFFSNGNIYSNIHNPQIGRIGDNLHDIIYNEIRNGFWTQTRNTIEPCKDCVFNPFCQPLSNYELVLKRKNLCMINT